MPDHSRSGPSSTTATGLDRERAYVEALDAAAWLGELEVPVPLQRPPLVEFPWADDADDAPAGPRAADGGGAAHAAGRSFVAEPLDDVPPAVPSIEASVATPVEVVPPAGGFVSRRDRRLAERREAERRGEPDPEYDGPERRVAHRRGGERRRALEAERVVATEPAADPPAVPWTPPPVVTPEPLPPRSEDPVVEVLLDAELPVALLPEVPPSAPPLGSPDLADALAEVMAAEDARTAAKAEARAESDSPSSRREARGGPDRRRPAQPAATPRRAARAASPGRRPTVAPPAFVARLARPLPPAVPVVAGTVVAALALGLGAYGITRLVVRPERTTAPVTAPTSGRGTLLVALGTSDRLLVAAVLGADDGTAVSLLLPGDALVGDATRGYLPIAGVLPGGVPTLPVGPSATGGRTGPVFVPEVPAVPSAAPTGASVPPPTENGATGTPAPSASTPSAPTTGGPGVTTRPVSSGAPAAVAAAPRRAATVTGRPLPSTSTAAPSPAGTTSGPGVTAASTSPAAAATSVTPSTTQPPAVLPGAGGNPGPDLAATARDRVSDALAVRLDGAWVLSPAALSSLVDAVGGVSVTVDRAVDAGGVTMPSGTTTLTGAQAAAYATWLAPQEQAEARLSRFQAVLSALVAALPSDQAAARTMVEATSTGSAGTLPADRLTALLLTVRRAAVGVLPGAVVPLRTVGGLPDDAVARAVDLTAARALAGRLLPDAATPTATTAATPPGTDPSGRPGQTDTATAG